MTRKQKLSVCNQVINHWVCNLFLAYAHKLSIKKGDISTDKCAFCDLFCGNSCHGCPIRSIGHNSCTLTPYWAVVCDLDFKRSPLKNTIRQLKFLERVCDWWLEHNK